MPCRAFFDSDAPGQLPTVQGINCVLMPCRAFFDSDPSRLPSGDGRPASVLMPCRAFFDSDLPCSTRPQDCPKLVLMPCRAFFDSDRAQDLKIVPHLRWKNRLKLSILSHRAGMEGLVGLPVSHPAGACAPPTPQTLRSTILAGGCAVLYLSERASAALPGVHSIRWPYPAHPGHQPEKLTKSSTFAGGARFVTLISTCPCPLAGSLSI